MKSLLRNSSYGALLATLFISLAPVTADLHQLNFHQSPAVDSCQKHRHIKLDARRDAGMDHPICTLRHVVASNVLSNDPAPPRPHDALRSSRRPVDAGLRLSQKRFRYHPRGPPSRV